MNPHQAHYHQQIQTLKHTIQQLEGRIIILTAGKPQPQPDIEEQIQQLSDFLNTEDITIHYRHDTKEWEIYIEYYKDGELYWNFSACKNSLEDLLEHTREYAKKYVPKV